MSNNYSCDICNKEFKRNCDLKKHKMRKTPCVKTDIKIDKKQEIIIDTKINKNKLINIFKNCLDLLRDNEGLTGEKALRNMTYLLILKLIEPYFGKEIDIDGYKYDFSHISKEESKELLRLTRFSNLAKEKELDIPNEIKNLWLDILSEHPSTKSIFLKDESFNIKNKSTYKKIINFFSIDLTNTEQDILGDAYEEMVQNIMVGKVLGQFFTPPSVKKIMVDLINPQIYPDGKIDTCCDPTMGTGGFLLTYLKYILTQAKEKNIKPDWDFIKIALYGKEIEPNTYQLAVSNMMISSGHIFEKLDRGDSIREPIDKKFDIVMSNPPFGIKGLKYDNFYNTIKIKYTPIKSDNAVSLFLQAIIYMLKIGGRCAIVLPDGQDLFSKTNKTLVMIREYLLKTCDLKEIIYLPSGIFTNTSIKTCIFYFEKKREGDEVLEVIIKETKNKETREYKFIDEYQTKNIKFYSLKENKKELLVEVSINKIIENKYSLNYIEYIEKIERKENKNIEIKKLGDICTFLTKSKRQASYGEEKGEYPFYTSSQNCTKYCDIYDYEEECLIIGTGGNANIKCDKKFSCSTDNFVIKINNEYLTKYVYYYILNNIEIIENGFIGIGIKHISKEYINNIEILLPTIEYQQQIIDELDYITNISDKISIEKIKNLKISNKKCLYRQKINKNNITKTLSEIVKYKSGKRIPKNYKLQDTKTLYPYIRISDINENSVSTKNIKYISEEIKNIIGKYIITSDDIFISIAGTIGLVGIIPQELENSNLTENAVMINIIDKKEILQKYLMYDIKYNQQKDIKEKTIGTTIPKLSIERLMSLYISIPTLEEQQKIINYCETNDNIIKLLKKDIINNKIISKEIINNI